MQALALADEIYIGAIDRPEKLREEERLDPAAIVQQLAAQGLVGYYSPSNPALLAQLVENTLKADQNGVRKPRLVAFFTNGSFDGIISGFVAAAKATAS